MQHSRLGDFPRLGSLLLGMNSSDLRYISRERRETLNAFLSLEC